MSITRVAYCLAFTLLFAFLVDTRTANAQPVDQSLPNTDALIEECSASDAVGPSAIDVLDTDFVLELRDTTAITGKCAKHVRSHVHEHVYFHGGATASISETGALLRRPADRTVARKSEVICDSPDDTLIYATLVEPGRLLGNRKSAKYVGVLKGIDRWFVAAFETDEDGKITSLTPFLESDQEIVAVGYFPHIHSGAGVLGLTVKSAKSNVVKLLTYSWIHREF